MQPEDLLRFVVLVCEQLKLRHLVTGSTATIAYGEPRFTNDIDIVLDLSAAQIAGCCDLFSDAESYLSRPTIHYRMGQPTGCPGRMEHSATRKIR